MIVVVIKVIGWIFVILPVAAFVAAGVKIIGGLMGDDGFIKMLVMSSFAVFALGVVILLMIYLTDVLQMFA
jgi:hypothetical protein